MKQRRLRAVCCLGFRLASSSLAHVDCSPLAHIDLRAQLAPEGGRQSRECVYRCSLYRFTHSQRGLAICCLTSSCLFPHIPGQHYLVKSPLLSFLHLVNQPPDLQLPVPLFGSVKIFTPVSATQWAVVLGEGSLGRTATLLGAGFRLSGALQFCTWLQPRSVLNSVTR